MASAVGSWRFLIIQTCCVAGWIITNSIHGWAHWDEYPFILLNLMFSVEAAYTGPILQLTGNRQAKQDQDRATRDDRILQHLEAIANHHGIRIEEAVSQQ